MLWDRDDTRRHVRKLCLSLTDKEEGETQDLFDDLRELQATWQATAASSESDEVRTSAALDTWRKVKLARNRCNALRKQTEKQGRTLPTLDSLSGAIQTFTKELMREGLSIDVDDTSIARKG